MKFRNVIMLAAALLLVGTALFAQEQKPAEIDTTFVTEDGTLLRYRGVQSFGDKPGGEERFKDSNDGRVPLGWGWRSITGWKEGDPRPKPTHEPGRVITDVADLYYHPDVSDHMALNFAEYFDYVYYGIKDLLGWTIDKPIPVVAPLDIDVYSERYGLPWWIPCNVVGDSIVVESIKAITARGIALESLTHIYVEWQIRQKTGDRVPYWFMYAVGSTMGSEGWVLKGQVEVLDPETWNLNIDQATMIHDLELFRDADRMRLEAATPGATEKERQLSRIAFWRAYRLGQNILQKEGYGKFKDLIAAMESDPSLSFEDGVQRIYGKGVDQLVADNEPGPYTPGKK